MDSEIDYTSDEANFVIMGYDWSVKVRLSKKLENVWHATYRRMVPGINVHRECQNLMDNYLSSAWE